MLTARNNTEGVGTFVSFDRKNVKELLGREWLLTNSRGGFAAGTLGGCNTRRYHGLLVGTLNPPANRVLSLSTCLETITVNGEDTDVSTFEFDGALAGRGYRYVRGFSQDVGVHFDYSVGKIDFRKSIYLMPDMDGVAIVYDFFDVGEGVDFSVRPFAAMRDFHSLKKENETLSAQWCGEGLAIREEGAGAGELFLRSDQMWFQSEEQWWYNFLYRKEKQRKQDCFENLWSPGVFRCNLDLPGRIVLWGSYGETGHCEESVEIDLDAVLDSLKFREHDLLAGAANHDETLKKLHIAAGQFVVEREIEGSESCTILAGYPWFLDWGRDTFISLDGLLLCTGRFAEAASVLTTFAHAVSEGMIPNRFDDYGGEAHYNSIDASMWYVHAAFQYARASDDSKTFADQLLPAVKEIMEAYRSGTRFGICADEDGLIMGGDAETQLTWMDAKCDGESFTPRYGKAVEVNALWYSNLCSLAEYYRDSSIDDSEYWGQIAEDVGESFCRVFWNESVGYLNDCVLPSGHADVSLRPNQIYAVSLPFSPLSKAQQKCVVGVVERELLTRYGLRTLSRDDIRYVGRYRGNQYDRDKAYHQGTVWPHLIGPFVEAYLRVNEFSKPARAKGNEHLEGLLEHLLESGCAGSISEIFDGDEPQDAKGCFAQAWAVAEVLRAYVLTNRPQ